MNTTTKSCCAPDCCAPPTRAAAAPLGADALRAQVRAHYSAAAQSCCALPGADPAAIAQALGYSPEALAQVEGEEWMTLGCGNPHALAALRPGERVLDLGSGGGLDCLLAGRAVGPQGRVIGVDMTPSMIDRARAAAQRQGLDQVEFRLGELEHLPLADQSVDVIISNCVINLSPQKDAVLAEIRRVLRPGGRVSISDVVALQAMPAALQEDMAAWGGCVAGAWSVAQWEAGLASAGLTQIRVTPRLESRALIAAWFPGKGWEEFVCSATVEATCP